MSTLGRALYAFAMWSLVALEIVVAIPLMLVGGLLLRAPALLALPFLMFAFWRSWKSYCRDQAAARLALDTATAPGAHRYTRNALTGHWSGRH